MKRPQSMAYGAYSDWIKYSDYLEQENKELREEIKTMHEYFELEGDHFVMSKAQAILENKEFREALNEIDNILASEGVKSRNVIQNIIKQTLKK